MTNNIQRRSGVYVILALSANIWTYKKVGYVLIEAIQKLDDEYAIESGILSRPVWLFLTPTSITGCACTATARHVIELQGQRPESKGHANLAKSETSGMSTSKFNDAENFFCTGNAARDSPSRQLVHILFT